MEKHVDDKNKIEYTEDGQRGKNREIVEVVNNVKEMEQ